MDANKKHRNTPSRYADAELGRRAHMLIWDAKRTQSSVADELGISSGSLGLKLKGERGWAFSEIIALAGVLNTSVSYLAGETENPRPAGPDGGLKVALPGLDSNQEPIGFKPAGTLVPFRTPSSRAGATPSSGRTPAPIVRLSSARGGRTARGIC